MNKLKVFVNYEIQYINRLIIFFIYYKIKKFN